MDVAGFINKFRTDMGDTEVPYLWSDEEIVDYLNEAVDEAAERAMLIEDSTSLACSRIAVTAGEASYALHDSVIRVTRVAFNGSRLSPTSVEAEDDGDTNWENRKGLPTRFIVNGNASSIRLVPDPVAPGTLAMTVNRRALTPLTADNDTAAPELKGIYHARLMTWMYRCAYLKQDAETFDRGKAAEYEGTFERAFGERPSAATRQSRNNRRPPVVRMNPGW